MSGSKRIAKNSEDVAWLPGSSNSLLFAWRSAPHVFAAHASGGRWELYHHLVYIGRRIAATIARGNGRLIVNCGPRHGKSLLVSHWTPVWFLDNMPQERVILTCYGDSLASEFGRTVRNEFENNPCCRASLRQDSTAASRWNTPQGGGMIATGVGGPIAGKGFSLGIIDDPTKNWQDAHSSQIKNMIWDWYHSVFYTRGEPGATIIIAMSRWGEDDLVGRLLQENTDPWEVITLPALAESGDILGRAVGEPLCPQRYDRPALENIRKAVGAAMWESLYQQNPQSYGLGRLYENFTSANIDDRLSLQPHLPLHLALDFNINPGMHVIIGQYDETADMFAAVHEIHGPRMNVRAACDVFKRWLGAHGWSPGGEFPWPELHVFGDASGSSEWAGTSESCYDIVRQRLASWGIDYRVRHLRANPPVRERIDTFNEALRDVEGGVHFRMHPRCVRLLADFRNLKTDQDGLEDKHDHTLSHSSSAAGYWVHYLRPLWHTSKPTIGGAVAVAPDIPWIP